MRGAKHTDTTLTVSPPLRIIVYSIRSVLGMISLPDEIRNLLEWTV